MASTKIQWATKVWNPVTGCTKISEGCDNCYAEKFAKRMKHNPNPKIAEKYFYGFNPFTHPESLFEPYSWKKPQRIFVCSMGDLFHKNIPFEFIEKVMRTIFDKPTHTFLILTKRPQRMKEFFEWLNNPDLAKNFPNMWLGVTAENQERADERIPILLQIPAAIRFVSIEPMLGPVDISMYMVTGWTEPPYDDIIHWVICGGETGNNARPMHPDWVNKIVKDCETYQTPFFFKQWGEHITIPREDVKKYPLSKLRTDLHNHSVYARVGKKKAGCEIGGVEYKQFPKTNNQ